MLKGCVVSDPLRGSLQRTATGNGWNDAGAVSNFSFSDPVGQRQQPIIGVSFRPTSNAHNFIMGLSRIVSATPQATYTSITYGIYLNNLRQVTRQTKSKI